jgi:hypothetical protein
MTTAVKDKPAVSASQQAEERIAEATQKLAALRHEAQTLNSARDAAVDQGDRAGMAGARARLEEIRDLVVIAERAILKAQIDLAQSLLDITQERMQQAVMAAATALGAEETAKAQSQERRRADVEAGRLAKWLFDDAVREDIGDARRERERRNYEAGNARSGMLEPQFALERAQQALDAHRRKHRLPVEN